MYSLVFFLCTGLTSCTRKQDQLTLLFKDQLAVGINIPKSLVAADRINDVKVKQNGNATGILGILATMTNQLYLNHLFHSPQV